MLSFVKAKLIPILFCSMSYVSIAYGDNNVIKAVVAPPLVGEHSVGIKLLRSEKNDLETAIYNAKGEQEPLTFGSFIDFSVQAILGKSLDNCNIKQSRPIFASYEWSGPNNELLSYIRGSQGQKKIFTLSNFLSALSDTVADCKEYNSAEQKKEPNEVPIFFEKGRNGKFQAVIVDAKGQKELLNLGNLISVTSEAFPDCNPGIEESRLIQIVFETNPNNDVQISLLDAYGKKEEFTFDNLAVAAAETLETCEKDKNKPFAKPIEGSIKIKFEKDTRGNLQTYLLTPAGDKVTLNLGTLLTAAAKTVPLFMGTGFPHLEISFERDQQGNVQGILKDLSGKTVELNLKNLLKAASYFPPSG
jgi:hypothetical protein